MLEVDDISSTTANDNTVTSVTGEDVLVAEQSCSNSSKEKEAGSSLSLFLSSSPIIQSIYEKNHDNSTHIIYTDIIPFIYPILYHTHKLHVALKI